MEPSPIVPGTNEAVWAAASLLLPLIVLAGVVLALRYFRRLRRTAEEAVMRAGAAEQEVAAVRADLRRQSA